LPIGGFSGTTPSPTLNQLKSDIRTENCILYSWSGRVTTRASFGYERIAKESGQRGSVLTFVHQATRETAEFVFFS